MIDICALHTSVSLLGINCTDISSIAASLKASWCCIFCSCCLPVYPNGSLVCVGGSIATLLFATILLNLHL